MPWEKSFNVDEAVSKAVGLFWEKGYSQSSMADILKTLGLTRGSFYNAFGSKKELFVKALLKYDQEHRRAGLQYLTTLDQPIVAIQSLFQGMVNEAIQDTDNKGCFLVNTSLEIEFHDSEVKEIVRKGINEIEVFFKQMIELAQSRSEIPKSIDPITTSKALVSMVFGIRVLSRGSYNESSLQAIADEAMRLVS